MNGLNGGKSSADRVKGDPGDVFSDPKRFAGSPAAARAILAACESIGRPACSDPEGIPAALSEFRKLAQ